GARAGGSDRRLALLLLAEQREQDHVADGVLAEEDHREAVDADADAAGRRHAVRERLDEVRVAGLGLGVAGLALRLLHPEALLLLDAVVELAERVRELHAADHALEPLERFE